MTAARWDRGLEVLGYCIHTSPSNYYRAKRTDDGGSVGNEVGKIILTGKTGIFLQERTVYENSISQLLRATD